MHATAILKRYSCSLLYIAVSSLGSLRNATVFTDTYHARDQLGQEDFKEHARVPIS